MSLETGIIALAEAIGTDVKTLTLKIGDLSQLQTAAKNNLVAAINEAAASGGGGGVAISDVTGLSTRLSNIDALIGDVESVLVAINGES